MDIEGYKIDISDVFGDHMYDIWGGRNDGDSSDLDSMMSVINILVSPKVIEISSGETEKILGAQGLKLVTVA